MNILKNLISDKQISQLFENYQIVCICQSLTIPTKGVSFLKNQIIESLKANKSASNSQSDRKFIDEKFTFDNTKPKTKVDFFLTKLELNSNESTSKEQSMTLSNLEKSSKKSTFESPSSCDGEVPPTLQEDTFLKNEKTKFFSSALCHKKKKQENPLNMEVDLLFVKNKKNAMHPKTLLIGCQNIESLNNIIQVIEKVNFLFCYNISLNNIEYTWLEAKKIILLYSLFSNSIEKEEPSALFQKKEEFFSLFCHLKNKIDQFDETLFFQFCFNNTNLPSFMGSDLSSSMKFEFHLKEALHRKMEMNFSLSLENTKSTSKLTQTSEKENSSNRTLHNIPSNLEQEHICEKSEIQPFSDSSGIALAKPQNFIFSKKHEMKLNIIKEEIFAFFIEKKEKKLNHYLFCDFHKKIKTPFFFIINFVNQSPFFSLSTTVSVIPQRVLLIFFLFSTLLKSLL